MDKFNKKANKIKLAVQLIWEARDLNIKIIIKLNIKSAPTQMLVKYKLVYKMWVTLQTQYKGTRVVFSYNTIKLYIKSSIITTLILSSLLLHLRKLAKSQQILTFPYLN